MKRHCASLLLIIALVTCGDLGFRQAHAAGLADRTIEELQAAIKEQQQKATDLQKQADALSANLAQKQRERLTLANQLATLTTKIQKTQVEIQITKTRIDQTDLEIQELERGINQKQNQITNDKTQLALLLRQQVRVAEVSPLAILFRSGSFAEYLRERRDIETINYQITRTVKSVEAAKQVMSTTKEQMDAKQREQEQHLATVARQRQELQKEEDDKEFLLSKTKSSETRFQQLLAEARREQANANAQISQLEKVIRDRISLPGTNTGGKIFAWPVSNNRITAKFHDPDYPFRGAFEHTGIDIRASQGTPIRAASDGYVGITQTGGARGYGYVLIVHPNGFSTVYGHVSKILAPVNTYVKQGDVIALSGGTPGSQGAGPFTTGAHLHFEVRLNSKPVNPLPYLP